VSPNILDQLFGKKKQDEQKKEEAPTSNVVDDDVARARREQLAQRQAEAEQARLRFEAQEKQRLAALEQQKAADQASVQKAAEQAAEEDKQRLAAMVGAPKTTQRIYIVKEDDYLSKIAKEVYGDAHRWPEIYEANKDVIGPNPNIIHGGQKLRIP
jgi:nucleoid-associated protein YgaU